MYSVLRTLLCMIVVKLKVMRTSHVIFQEIERREMEKTGLKKIKNKKRSMKKMARWEWIVFTEECHFEFLDAM